MNTAAKLAGFAVVPAAAFAAAAGLGNAVGPAATPAAPTAAHDGHSTTPARSAMTDTTHEHTSSPAMAGMDHGAEASPGLAVAAGGYTLVPETTMLPTGGSTFNFRILGPDGGPLTRYAPEHEGDLHLIVVRRDLSGYQHLHPSLAAHGTWSVPLQLPTAGAYKAFADFRPAGAAAGLTLAVDLFAPGDFQPAPLPAPVPSASVDGYTVTLAGALRAGQQSELTFTLAKDGRPVTNLQPYLGAYGHLVALRAGDLAYSHVHPEGAPGDGHTPAGPGVSFHAELPTAENYRLFLDFQIDGVVRTAAFTATAGT